MVSHEQVLQCVRQTVAEIQRNEIAATPVEHVVMCPDFPVAGKNDLQQVASEDTIFICDTITPGMNVPFVLLSDANGRAHARDLLAHAKMVTVFAPDMRLLKQLAHIEDAGNEMRELLLTALLCGKKVELADARRCTGGSRIQECYTSLLQQCADIGCDVRRLYPEAESVPAEYSNLLLESDVCNEHSLGAKKISVSRACVITPLAHDKARELSMEIIRMG